jgi:hypothetical protein
MVSDHREGPHRVILDIFGRARDFRSSPMNRHRQHRSAGLKGAINGSRVNHPAPALDRREQDELQQELLSRLVSRLGAANVPK